MSVCLRKGWFPICSGAMYDTQRMSVPLCWNVAAWPSFFAGGCSWFTDELHLPGGG